MAAPLTVYLSDAQRVKTPKSKPTATQFYSYAAPKTTKTPKRRRRKPAKKIIEGTSTTCGCGKPVKFAVPLLCEDCYITQNFVRRV